MPLLFRSKTAQIHYFLFFVLFSSILISDLDCLGAEQLRQLQIPSTKNDSLKNNISTLKSVLKEDQKNHEARKALINIYGALKEYDSLSVHLDALIHNEYKASEKGDHKILFWEGKAQQEVGMNSIAAEYFLAAIKLDSTVARYHLHAGLSHFRQNSYVVAFRFFAQTVNHARSDSIMKAEGYYWQGRVKHIDDDSSKAKEYYENAMRFNPYHIEARQYLEEINPEPKDMPSSSEKTHSKPNSLPPNQPIINPDSASKKPESSTVPPDQFDERSMVALDSAGKDSATANPEAVKQLEIDEPPFKISKPYIAVFGMIIVLVLAFLIIRWNGKRSQTFSTQGSLLLMPSKESNDLPESQTIADAKPRVLQLLSLRKGEMIGNRYRIDHRLGAGGMGVVYKAYDTTMRRTVAIKTIKVPEESDTVFLDQSVSRFHKEMIVTAKMSHPKIVTIHDFIHVEDEQGAVFCMIMEFVPGKSLETLLREKGKFSFVQARDVMIQTCEALQFAHDQGVIHRDLKPGNLMLEDGNLKVLDFGVAHMQTDLTDSIVRTGTGELIGTPAYSSPEQQIGGEIDQRTDIFSLGLLFFELLTGERLVKLSYGKSFSEVFHRFDEITPSVAQLLTKMLAEKPNERFQNARDVASALMVATN